MTKEGCRFDIMYSSIGTPRRGKLWAIKLCVVAMAVSVASACIPESTPEENSSPSPSPSRVAVPTWSPEKPPEKSENIDDKTKEGAVSFVRYFYKIFEYERHGDDWTDVRNLGTNTCHRCDVLTRGDYARKYQPEGPAEINPTKQTVDLEGNRAQVSVQRVSAAGTWQANPYEEPRHFEEQEWQDIFYLVYKDGRWLVDGLEIYFSGTVQKPTAPYRL